MLKLIVGLGNPGEKYKNNRHNVGFSVVDAIATRDTKNEIRKTGHQIRSMKYIKRVSSCVLRLNDILLAKPQTFMNSSGRAVKKLVSNLAMKQLSNLYIVHDDLDIPLGQYKIQFGKGPRQHNGIKSVQEALGTKDFWRVRVGIENREWKTPNSKLQIPNRVSGEEYVLEDFTKEEQKVVTRTISKLVGLLIAFPLPIL